MIFVGIGANLPSSRFGEPLNTCEAAISALAGRQIAVRRVSPWYCTTPVPVSDQPNFVNGVAEIATDLTPEDLLRRLHEIEKDFGRIRRIRNESRVLDLDLLAFSDHVIDQGEGLRLPHPRMAERAFVLLPLRDIAPGWCHPELGRTVETLIEELAPGQDCRRIS